MSSRVVVAMSGGVDSSAAAALLKEQGHEVIGITLRVWSAGGAGRHGSCCAPEDIEDARAVAEALGIPFYVAGAEELFRQEVVAPFVREYVEGRTPVPCVACNQRVKFDFLLRRARALGGKLATGHYARVREEAGRFHLERARDLQKDQTYFLFTLAQEELSDLVFPVGELTKSEVREVARRHGLPTSAKPESMEICFVPDGDHAGFVERAAGPQPPGEIVSSDGRVLGAHAGVHRFTVGQRRGLGLSSPEPLYVQRLDAAARQVVVGPAPEVEGVRFEVLRPHWISSAPPPPDRQVEVKIRHRHGGAAAHVARATPERACVELLAPARAISPGQAAVFYEGDRVLGGGFIA